MYNQRHYLLYLILLLIGVGYSSPINYDRLFRDLSVNVDTSQDPNPPEWKTWRFKGQNKLNKSVRQILDDGYYRVASPSSALDDDLKGTDEFYGENLSDNFEKFNPEFKDEDDGINLMLRNLKDGGILKYSGLDGKKGLSILEMKATILKPLK